MAEVNREWQEQGVEIKEPDDHILELYKDGQLIARFSQTGVTIENILKEINTHGREN